MPIAVKIEVDPSDQRSITSRARCVRNMKVEASEVGCCLPGEVWNGEACSSIDTVKARCSSLPTRKHELCEEIIDERVNLYRGFVEEQGLSDWECRKLGIRVHSAIETTPEIAAQSDLPARSCYCSLNDLGRGQCSTVPGLIAAYDGPMGQAISADIRAMVNHFGNDIESELQLGCSNGVWGDATAIAAADTDAVSSDVIPVGCRKSDGPNTPVAISGRNRDLMDQFCAGTFDNSGRNPSGGPQVSGQTGLDAFGGLCLTAGVQADPTGLQAIASMMDRADDPVVCDLDSVQASLLSGKKTTDPKPITTETSDGDTKTKKTKFKTKTKKIPIIDDDGKIIGFIEVTVTVTVEETYKPDSNTNCTDGPDCRGATRLTTRRTTRVRIKGLIDDFGNDVLVVKIVKDFEINADGDEVFTGGSIQKLRGSDDGTAVDILFGSPPTPYNARTRPGAPYQTAAGRLGNRVDIPDGVIARHLGLKMTWIGGSGPRGGFAVWRMGGMNFGTDDQECQDIDGYCDTCNSFTNFIGEAMLDCYESGGDSYSCNAFKEADLCCSNSLVFGQSAGLTTPSPEGVLGCDAPPLPGHVDAYCNLECSLAEHEEDCERRCSRRMRRQNASFDVLERICNQAYSESCGSRKGTINLHVPLPEAGQVVGEPVIGGMDTSFIFFGGKSIPE